MLKNNFNLNIPRYVDNFEEEPVDLNALLLDMKKQMMSWNRFKESLFFKIHYVNLMESIFKSHLSALASPESTQKSIQTMLLIYQHMMNKRKLETFCIKSMTSSPFTSASVMNCKK